MIRLVLYVLLTVLVNAEGLCTSPRGARRCEPKKPDKVPDNNPAQEIAFCLDNIKKTLLAVGYINPDGSPKGKDDNGNASDPSKPNNECPTAVDPRSPNADKPPNGKKRSIFKREDPNPKESPYDKCIPLTSSNPVANPYHELLTGLPKNQVIRRVGLGAAYKLPGGGNGILCPKGVPQCDFKLSESVSIATTTSFSVNDGFSNSWSNTNTTTWTHSDSNSEVNSITSISEENWSRTKVDEKNGVDTTDWQHTHTKGVENSVARTITKGTEGSVATATTWDDERSENEETSDGWDENETNTADRSVNMENSNSNTNTLDTTKSVSVRCQSGSTNTWGGSAEFDVFFVKAQVNYSHTTTKDNEVTFTISRSWKNDRGFTRNCNSDSKRGNSRARGKNHNQTNGKSKTRRDGGSTTVTNGHSESDSTETRRGDSTSDAWSNGGSQSRGWSVSNSDMYGGSQSHQVGSSSERGRVDSFGGDSSKAYTFTTDKSFDHGSSNTTTRTLETSQTINIPGDSCGIPICRVMVESIITPWACKTDEPDEFNIYTTELQFLPPEMANSMQVKCILQMAPCKPTLPGFELLPSIYTATEAQPFAFRSGAIFLSTSTEMSIKSKNGEYSLQFVQSATGYSNLAVIRFNSPKPVWETGIKGLGESRFYISDDGHLIQEGKGVYSNSPDEWTKVWSNQPLNLNFPVGVRKERGYTLFLNDIGELELYDGALIRIWSSTKSKNKLGYKYPTSNIYPSVYPTEPNAAGQVDPHNSIPTGIVWKKDNFIGKNCTAILRQNEGIVSQNGRFRLYLRETGNLVIRDGPRLMWETSTADLWYAKGPFRAIIGPEGYFQVKDSQNAIIWQTEGQGLQRVEVGDDGNLAGFGPDGERWSLRVKENVPFSGWIVFKHPYLHCDDCIDCVVNAPVNPLVNLASGKCITLPNSKDCEMFAWNPVQYQYVSMNVTEFEDACLGSAFGKYSECTSKNSWRHYDDGFLTLREFPNKCLNAFGNITSCTDNNLRIDKLWSHGKKIITSLSSDGDNRFLLHGHEMKSNGTSLTIGANGDLKVRTDSKIGFYRTGKVFNEPTLLELKKDGTLAISNLAANRTLSVVPTSKGVAPYRLQTEPNGIVVLRDAKNSVLWNLKGQ